MISFDIFDTLVTRKTFLPMGTHLLMQERMRENVNYLGKEFVDSFPIIRENAENAARNTARMCGMEEITIDEIYFQMQKNMDISSDMILKIKELEIQAEKDNILPIHRNIEKLKGFLAKGEKVILISDMYINEIILRSILNELDYVFLNITIYVSCDYRKTKRSGKLYIEISRIENISTENWTHYGDNEVSDIQIAKLMGIKAIKTEKESMKPWEVVIAAKSNFKTNLRMQVSIGMSTYIRMENHLSSAAKIGASIGGMVLYPFIEWLLRMTIKLDINRLYFIARDGYTLKKMVDIIVDQRKLKIKTYYVYGSRRAWDIGEDQEKRNILGKYILQEIDFSDDNFAFIDMQGKGDSFSKFCKCAKGLYNKPMKIFYYDLNQRKKHDECEMYSFYTNSECVWCESFSRAPHDVTIGYKYEGSKIVPELYSKDKSKWIKSGVLDYINGIEIYTYYISEALEKINVSLEDRQLPMIPLCYYRENPDREIYDYFSNIPHGETPEAEAEGVYAPRLSKEDIFSIFMLRSCEELKDYYKGSDIDYSLKFLDEEEKKLLKWCLENCYGDIGKKIHRWKRKNQKCFCKNVPKTLIYGAGIKGERLYRLITLFNDDKVVGWVDLKAEEYRKKGYPVEDISSIAGRNFDYIVLTMNVTDTVRQMLELSGIDAKKIIVYDEFCQMLFRSKLKS